MENDNRKKIFISGYDIFSFNAVEMADEYKKICLKNNFIPLHPIDNDFLILDYDFSNEIEKTKKIVELNLKLINECDILVANLNPFRGLEPDSGTAWECGYAKAINKIIYAYADFNKFDTDEDFGFNIKEYSFKHNIMLFHNIDIINGSFLEVIEILNKKYN